MNSNGSARSSSGNRDGSDGRYHRPVLRAHVESDDGGLDPATRTELAHDLAALLVSGPGLPRNADSARRFVTLAEDYGLETVAELWASAPPVSLPGALWRLYALRAWIRADPGRASRWFTTGLGSGDEGARITVPRVVAGVQEPPGPAEVARLADEILTGAFLGDFGDALARAAAFVAVAAAGRAVWADEAEEGGAGSRASARAAVSTPRAGTSALGRFVTLAEDLAQAAGAYRAGTLD